MSSPADPHTDAPRAAFEKAFVAIGHLLGRRDEELVQGLARPGAAARDVQGALAAKAREARAMVLARELARIAAALEARRLR
jgi:hypothetical protein